MKPIIFTIAIVVSLAVSVALMVTMPNISDSNLDVSTKPDTELIKPTVQPNTEPAPTRSDTRSFTSDDLVAHPDQYDYEEAWSIMHAEYIDATQQCHDESEDIIELNECLTSTNSRWLVIEDALERVWQ